MLSAPSQLLLRNSELFASGKWLLANPDAHIFQELKQSNLNGFHQYFDQFQASQRISEQHQFFSAAYQGEQDFDGAVVYLPKAKAHARMLIANIAMHLKAEGTLLLVGENKAGIKSAAKLLEAVGGKAQKIDSARHCGLYGVQIKESVPPFKLNDWLQTMPVVINGIELEIASLPGVFSHGELDAGTQLLLENTEQVPNGDVLDFACGAGVIGCYLGKQNPAANINMSDINALALYCAEQSAKANGIQAQVIASNGLADMQGKFAAIYTNPPFHTGVSTDYKITANFIDSVKTHLHANAALTLVANRFLPYPEQLQGVFKYYQVLAQTNKFNLYQCR